MIDFLLEIGFEEFPPHLLIKSAEELYTKVENLFKNERIFYRSIRKIYTPRRMGVLILGVARRQNPRVVEIKGPPKKFAFDKENRPTPMLQGFLNSHNLKLSDVKVAKTEKGEYIVGTLELPGRDTEDILYSEIPRIIQSLEFPKTMVWNETGIRFPRPIRWIVALLDRRPLRFKYAGIVAERYSMPNFHHSFNPIRLEKPREYLNALRHGGVVCDPNERLKLIRQKIDRSARSLKAEPVYDEVMLEEINCTVEYPEAVSGEFDPDFLKLPQEVLKMTLKALGNLIWIKGTNRFICIFNGRKRAGKNVAAGYTRVLKARLQDALFYYENDLRSNLEEMLEQTRGMVWLENLGTVYEKAMRLEKACDYFSDFEYLDLKSLRRAARLCKADLLSQMVREKEFTSLQGIMGYYYAKANGEPESVALIIKEHYLPISADDKLPLTKEAAVLSIIDKLDNVLGAFLSGQRPSGSYDPLAVRRNGYGVINLIDSFQFDLNLFSLIDRHLKLFKIDLDNKGIIYDFFKERLARYLEDKGFRYDEIDAVLANTSGNVYDARLRCEALKGMRGKPEFVQLVIGQKRVRNILKGIKGVAHPEPSLFKIPAEEELYKQGCAVQKRLEPLFLGKRYGEVLKLLLGMRKEIDKFFDDVLVMCEDRQLQKNRLALVNFINELFLKFADLSRIVIEGEREERNSVKREGQN